MCMKEYIFKEIIILNGSNLYFKRLMAGDTLAN